MYQEAELGGIALVDSCSGFNKLKHMSMLCMARHWWLSGEQFIFNCYKHYVHLHFHWLGIAPTTLLSQEEVTQGETLLMVLYVITLFPLVEDLWYADPGLLSPLYMDNVVFYGG